MAISTQCRVRPVGKIRIGYLDEKATKGDLRRKAETFILTSSNPTVLEQAAELYGGQVEKFTRPAQAKGVPSDHTHRVFTTATQLKVMFRPRQVLDVSRQQYDGPFLIRSCNGETILYDGNDKTLIGQPCQCPEDDEERKALAAQGLACAERSRLNVQFWDLPFGTWQLVTSSENIPALLRDTQAFLREANLLGQPIAAWMVLEQATSRMRREGKNQTFKYGLVTLQPVFTAAQLLEAGQQAQRPALTAGERAQAAIYDLTGNDAPVSVEPVTALMTRAEFWAELKQIWQEAQMSEAVRTEEIAAIAHGYGGTVPVQAYATVVAAQRAKYPPRDPETGERIPDDLGQTSGQPTTDPNQPDLWEGEEGQPSNAGVEGSN